jgi:ABC-2 type transport system permease protein
VLRMLVLRDLQRQYTKFRLGYLWSLLEPLGMSLVLWLVFSVLLGERALGLQPYLLFLSVAILPWWWFSKSVNASTKIFRRMRGEIAFTHLPPQIWVLRTVISSMVEFILSLPVVLLAVAVTGFLPGPWIVMFPVAIVLQFMLLYGIGLLVASLSIVIPDVARLVKIILRAMFYLSPILYSISNIPTAVQSIAAINPLVGILGLYRIGWWPEEQTSPWALVTSLGVAAAFLIAGIISFHVLKPRILKEA